MKRLREQCSICNDEIKYNSKTCSNCNNLYCSNCFRGGNQFFKSKDIYRQSIETLCLPCQIKVLKNPHCDECNNKNFELKKCSTCTRYLCEKCDSTTQTFLRSIDSSPQNITCIQCISMNIIKQFKNVEISEDDKIILDNECYAYLNSKVRKQLGKYKNIKLVSDVVKEIINDKYDFEMIKDYYYIKGWNLFQWNELEEDSALNEDFGLKRM